MTRADLIRAVRDAEEVDVQAICGPDCGLTTVRVDDFYPPSPAPGETDAFDPVSGRCLSCGERVYFSNPVPWSRVAAALPARVTLVDVPLDPDDPPLPPSPSTPPTRRTPSTHQGRDDEPDIPE